MFSSVAPPEVQVDLTSKKKPAKPAAAPSASAAPAPTPTPEYKIGSTALAIQAAGFAGQPSQRQPQDVYLEVKRAPQPNQQAHTHTHAHAHKKPKKKPNSGEFWSSRDLNPIKRRLEDDRRHPTWSARSQAQFLETENDRLQLNRELQMHKLRYFRDKILEEAAAKAERKAQRKAALSQKPIKKVTFAP